MQESNRERFLKRYQPIHKPLDRYCRLISGNTSDGADLLHDTVLLTMESFHKIRDEEKLKSYMYSVATQLNRKRYLKARRQIRLEAEELDLIVGKLDDAEAKVEFQLIYEKILSLPHMMSEALILFHIMDMKMEQIQQIQGGTLSAVKLRLKRGRANLMKMVSEPQQVLLLSLFTF